MKNIATAQTAQAHFFTTEVTMRTLKLMALLSLIWLLAACGSVEDAHWKLWLHPHVVPLWSKLWHQTDKQTFSSVVTASGYVYVGGYDWSNNTYKGLVVRYDSSGNQR
jgi:hypothetical protein